MNFDIEKTVDIFRRAPKPISPQVHRWIDIAAASTFAVMGGIFLSRGKRRAATAAFIDCGAVACMSLFTDYDGDGVKPISFKMHGFIDLVLAATAASEPPMLGFPADAEAALFYSGGPGVVAVVALTDWDAAERGARRLEVAA